MILADVFKNSEFARTTDYSTNEFDDPVVVQFAANNGADLADAAELVSSYAGGIGNVLSWKCYELKQGRNINLIILYFTHVQILTAVVLKNGRIRNALVLI
jgi:galactitol-specific phosphotransferase system IIC component